MRVASGHDLHTDGVPINLPLLPIALVAEEGGSRGTVSEDGILIDGSILGQT